MFKVIEYKDFTMQEQLLWRAEWMNLGPFSNDFTFKQIQKRIKELGPKVDSFDTTFLNIYDQNATPPCMVKEFKSFQDKLLQEKNLRFGFNSKEDLEYQFRIDKETVQYSNPRYFQQFVRLLDQAYEFTVKVYLVTPIASNKTEAIFDINTAILVDTANSYEQYQSL